MPGRGRPRGFDRDAALRTAMRLFWARGYEGVAISDLTAEMGIGTRSLYTAFGSKERLFREAVDLYAALDDTAGYCDLPTARDTVERLLRARAAAYVDPATPPGCMIVLAATNTSQDNDAVRDFLAGIRARDRDLLTTRLAKARADGEVPTATDPDTVVAFYLSVLYGLSMHAKDGRSAAELDAVVDTAMAVWDMVVG
ncbi:TetR/AcrR family transcriptional regulator [Actinokineospora enzanensis]|uniref:TetR/AcrR family transcriptional regulator n=1 Tax=Actinokineospora enzanensis TaxID=155975 RepID=UPI00037C345D|nr:TetR/AcrR family transcriptional regulator [Actinokineospora enzanensis]